MPASTAQRAATAERRSRAIAMRIAGADLDTIVRTLGYSSRAAASKDITRTLQERTKEQIRNAELLRSIELARLDRMQAGLWTQAAGGDPRAVDAILRIMAQRIKLLGLDTAPAPTSGAKSLLGDLARGIGVVADMLPDTDSTADAGD